MFGIWKFVSSPRVGGHPSFGGTLTCWVGQDCLVYVFLGANRIDVRGCCTIRHREPSYPCRIWVKDQTTLIARVLCLAVALLNFNTHARSASARTRTEIFSRSLGLANSRRKRSLTENYKLIRHFLRAPTRLRAISVFSVPDFPVIRSLIVGVLVSQ